MLLHLNKFEFENFIEIIIEREDIDKDIIEKDYYVCLILKELSKRQDYLKSYFKGGTAVYKILDTMNRFSEDIDLTVQATSRSEKFLTESVLKTFTLFPSRKILTVTSQPAHSLILKSSRHLNVH